MTVFDYVVIAIVMLSAAVGWWRGFMYELFSLISWIVAYVVARNFSDEALPYVPQGVGVDAIRSAAAFAGLFIVSLLIGAVFAWFLARLAKFAGLSGMDGKFGAIFGMLRGVMIVISLVWLAGLTEIPQLPFWRDAMSSKPLEKLAVYARNNLPEDVAQDVSDSTNLKSRY